MFFESLGNLGKFQPNPPQDVPKIGQGCQGPGAMYGVCIGPFVDQAGVLCAYTGKDELSDVCKFESSTSSTCRKVTGRHRKPPAYLNPSLIKLPRNS